MSELSTLEIEIKQKNPSLTDKEVAQMVKLKQQENKLKEKQKRLRAKASERKRRERTKLLCDLGGLVLKAGLEDMDRETLLGALLGLSKYKDESSDNQKLAEWKKRGSEALKK